MYVRYGRFDSGHFDTSFTSVAGIQSWEFQNPLSHFYPISGLIISVTMGLTKLSMEYQKVQRSSDQPPRGFFPGSNGFKRSL